MVSSTHLLIRSFTVAVITEAEVTNVLCTCMNVQVHDRLSAEGVTYRLHQVRPCVIGSRQKLDLLDYQAAELILNQDTLNSCSHGQVKVLTLRACVCV